ncbi:MAG TPA: hypothetical protein VHG51_01520 [Longimicrobiaceae bacterium]|nr:hypothetical protein [Longimicrobiaceae bacterium]
MSPIPALPGAHALAELGPPLGLALALGPGATSLERRLGEVLAMDPARAAGGRSLAARLDAEADRVVAGR